jgi:hypothetical protein
MCDHYIDSGTTWWRSFLMKPLFRSNYSMKKSFESSPREFMYDLCDNEKCWSRHARANLAHDFEQSVRTSTLSPNPHLHTSELPVTSRLCWGHLRTINPYYIMASFRSGALLTSATRWSALAFLWKCKIVHLRTSLFPCGSNGCWRMNTCTVATGSEHKTVRISHFALADRLSTFFSVHPAIK